MKSVRIQHALKQYSNLISEFTNYIKSDETVEIISKSETNIDFFIDNIFNNYSVRKEFFSREIDKYILISIENIPSDVHELDAEFLMQVYFATNLEFKSITSLKNYLTEDSKKIIVYSAKDNDDFSRRLLLAYKFILGESIVFVFGSNYETDLLSKKIYLSFSDDFIGRILEIESGDTEIISSNSNILREINGDLALISVYLNRKPQEQLEQPNIVSDDQDHEELGYFSLENSLGEILRETMNEDLIEETKTESSQTVIKIEEPKLSAEINSNRTDQTIPEVKTEIETDKKNENITEHVNKAKEIKNSASAVAEVNEKDNSNINLTEREAKVYYQLQNKKFITRDELVENVWGKELVGKTHDDAIDQFISRLRRKFVKAGYDKSYIYSKKGEGVGIN